MQYTYCIPSLIKRLSCHRNFDPFMTLNLYRGNDWNKLVSTYPVCLWKNDYLELKLKRWSMLEKHTYKNNYSTIHTKVLEGKIKSVMNISDIYLSQTIHKNESYTFHPFSKCHLTTLEPSVTIQLYYYTNI